jgi:class 3 adenylate cyclase
MIEILNALFDAQAIAIRDHGGEILRTIGDGILAVFPIEESRERRYLPWGNDSRHQARAKPGRCGSTRVNRLLLRQRCSSYTAVAREEGHD